MGVIAWLGIVLGGLVLNALLFVLLVSILVVTRQNKFCEYITKASDDSNVPDSLFIFLILVGMVGLPAWYFLYQKNLVATALARQREEVQARTNLPRLDYDRLFLNHYEQMTNTVIRRGIPIQMADDTDYHREQMTEMGPGEDYSKFGEWFKQHCKKEPKENQ